MSNPDWGMRPELGTEQLAKVVCSSKAPNGSICPQCRYQKRSLDHLAWAPRDARGGIIEGYQSMCHFDDVLLHHTFLCDEGGGVLKSKTQIPLGMSLLCVTLTGFLYSLWMDWEATGRGGRDQRSFVQWRGAHPTDHTTGRSILGLPSKGRTHTHTRSMDVASGQRAAQTAGKRHISARAVG